jgi:hypothetical protein
VITEISIIGHTKSRHAADTGAGIGQHAEHGAIAQPDNVAGIDGPEQFAGLLNSELSGLASVTLYFVLRTEAKGLRATAWQCTRASKKCRIAARAWFRWAPSSGSFLMYSPARQ